MSRDARTEWVIGLLVAGGLGNFFGWGNFIRERHASERREALIADCFKISRDFADGWDACSERLIRADAMLGRIHR